MTKTKILCDTGESLGAPLAPELVQPPQLPASAVSHQPRASGKAQNSLCLCLQLHVCCPGSGYKGGFILLFNFLDSEGPS